MIDGDTSKADAARLAFAETKSHGEKHRTLPVTVRSRRRRVSPQIRHEVRRSFRTSKIGAKKGNIGMSLCANATNGRRCFAMISRPPGSSR